MTRFAFALLLFACPLAGQAQNASAMRDCSHARIVVRDSASMLGISGVYRNGSEETSSLRYELATIKSGSSSNRNLQSGRFTCSPHTDIALSKVTVNAGARDHVAVVLRILDGAVVVARDSLAIR